MSLKKILSALVFFQSLLVIFVSSADAGIVVTNEESSPPSQTKTISKTYIDSNKVRSEAHDKSGDQITIFRGDKNIVWIINSKDKSYAELTKESLKQMNKQLNDSMKAMQKQMEEQSKNLPPEQKKMMEDMMKQTPQEAGKSKAVAPAADLKFVYKKLEENVKINNWVTTHYNELVNNQKESEVWVAPLSQIGFSPADFNVLESFVSFFNNFSGGSSSGLLKGGKDWEQQIGFQGVPVKEIDYTGGAVSFQSQITDVKKQDLAASLFELPAGYKKKNMP